jgi:uncharacterized coiled-coil DUF342 family protein
MNSQEIIEKIKVVLGLEATETHTESAPVVELAEVTINSEELEALRSERDDLKKKVDELQAMIDERNAKDNEINDIVENKKIMDEPMGDELGKMEQKMSKPFSGAPVEEKRINLSSPQSKRTDVKSRVFARLNA